MPEIEASASAKLVLLGEYAVLEGAPAVVVACDPCAHATWQASEVWVVDAPDVGVCNMPYVCQNGKCVWQGALPEQEQALKAVACVVETMWACAHENGGVCVPGVLHVETTDFYNKDTHQKWGVGSSAAVVVACVKVLGDAWLHAGFSADDERVFECAYRAHTLFQQGKGSGVDVAASVWDGVIAYQAPVNGRALHVEPLRWPRNLAYATVYTSASVNTPHFVSHFGTFKKEQPTAFQNLFDLMQHTCQKGLVALRCGDGAGFLEAYRAYQGVFERLDAFLGPLTVYTPAHRRIAQLVGAMGGVYKPSGAGGGDVGVALWNADVVPHEALCVLRDAGFKVLPFKWHIHEE